MTLTSGAIDDGANEEIQEGAEDDSPGWGRRVLLAGC